MLDAGFPVEWVVITDEGSVYIHYANPVVMGSLSLDDRPIVEEPGPGLRVVIGTGQTVELTTRRASGSWDTVVRCANCKQPVPDKIEHPWVPCPWPVLDEPGCRECRVMETRRTVIESKMSLAHQPWWRGDGYCPACGQKPARMRLIETVQKMVAKVPASEKSNKTLRELARLMRRLKKETDG